MAVTTEEKRVSGKGRAGHPSGLAVPVPLNRIVVDDRFRVRSRLDERTVERYVEIFDRLPPVTLARLDGRLYLVDGFHRLEAAERLRRKEIQAVVQEMDEVAALRMAIRVNSRQGLPLSLRERKEAAKKLLKLRPELSNRAVAEDAGLSDKTVGEIRKALERTAEIPQLPQRVGRDQRVRRAPKPAPKGQAVRKPAPPTGRQADRGVPAPAAAAGKSPGAASPAPDTTGPAPPPSSPPAAPGKAKGPVAVTESAASPEPAELLRRCSRWLESAAQLPVSCWNSEAAAGAVKEVAAACVKLWDALKPMLDTAQQQALRDQHVQPLRVSLQRWASS